MVKSPRKNRKQVKIEQKKYFSFSKIFMFFIHFGFIALGIYLIVNGSKNVNFKKTRTLITTGTVTDKSIFCTRNTNRYGSTTSINCRLEATYAINNINYKKIFKTSDKYYYPNDQIKLYYDPNNIENINVFQDDYYYSGVTSITIGVLLIIFIFIIIYFTYRSQNFAENQLIIMNEISGIGLDRRRKY